MRRLFALLLLSLAVSMPAGAQPVLRKTVGGYPASVSESKLDALVALVAAGDRVAVEAYLRANPDVVLLTEGLDVEVVETSWGKVQIRRVGTLAKVWTVREALR